MDKQGSILIVDDELGPRESLRIILQPYYDIQTATNGKEALFYIRKGKMDIVTLDLNMPGISGIEVLKEITKLNQDIDVIIVTGFGTTKNAIEAVYYGTLDFICKPFNVAEIFSTVQKCFERKKARVQIKNLIGQTKLLWDKILEGEPLSNLAAGMEADPNGDPFTKEFIESIQLLQQNRGGKTSLSFLDFLNILSVNLGKREPCLDGHAKRVLYYAERIVQDIYLSPKEKESLQIAAHLHDVGKIGLRIDSNQKDKSNRYEYLYLRLHPIKTLYITQSLNLPPPAISAIRHHHERWDGMGYPDNLCKEEIPLVARIISLANYCDSLRLDLFSQENFPVLEVQEKFEKAAGVLFDPVMVDLLVRQLKNLAPVPPQTHSNPPDMIPLDRN
jgi:putative two-component system response regulator